MREQRHRTLMMKVRRSITRRSSPTWCLTTPSTRQATGVTNAGMIFFPPTAKFQPTVDLLQTSGNFQRTSDHGVYYVEENSAHISIVTIVVYFISNALIQIFGGSKEEKPRNIVSNPICTAIIFMLCCLQYSIISSNISDSFRLLSCVFSTSYWDKEDQEE